MEYEKYRDGCFRNGRYDFKDLLGCTLTAAERTIGEFDEDLIVFTLNTGEKYALLHYQDCCENVGIEDICGDLEDLIGSPLVVAEKVRNGQNINPVGVPKKDYQDSFTWTFYKLDTIKGGVTIRWYGESNGYYSEGVDFVLVIEEDS